MSELLKRRIAYLLSFLMAIYPLLVSADRITDAGLDAQKFGEQSVQGFNNAQTQYSNGDIVLPSMTNGVFSNSGATTVPNKELFSGTSGAAPMTEFFPAGGEPDINNLQSISTDGDALDKQGKTNQSILWNDASLQNPTTIGGTVYKTLVESANKPRPDLTNDPMFDQTKKTYTDINLFAQSFGDCSTTTSFNNVTNTKHIPDYHTCERILDKSRKCEVAHTYDVVGTGTPTAASVVQAVSGNISMQQVDADTVRVNIGLANNGNNCWYPSQVASLAFPIPSTIKKITLVEGHYGSYGSYKVQGSTIFTFLPTITRPVGFNCADYPYTRDTINKDITYTIISPLSPINAAGGYVVDFTFSGDLTLEIDYGPSMAVANDTWTPQECIDASKEMGNGFVTGSVSCAAMPPLDANGCATIKGMTVCNSDLAPSPFSNIQPLCQNVSVDLKYDFYKGNFCYVDASGANVCVDAGNATTNSCQKYETNPSCGYISGKCLDGAAATDGTCYIQEEVWDCGENVSVPDVAKDTQVQCSGPIRCMGNDCLNPQPTQSGSFAEASALLNAAQFMTQDMNCVTPSGGTQTCEVFSGSPLQCKKAVGGIQDCCDVPTNVSAGTYIAAIMALSKLDTALMALDEKSAIKGAYQTLREPVTQSVTEVTKPFTSYVENVSGSVTEFVKPVTTVVQELKTEISNAITSTLNEMASQLGIDMGADAAASSAGTGVINNTTQNAGTSLMNNVGAVASTVMWVYTAYVVSVMVVQMLFPCETPEFELAAKKEIKSCHFVGSYCSTKTLGVCLEKKESYCCFNSPLSRIINEQIRPQLAKSFGDPRNPDCGGVTVADIGAVDWTKVDLGEWTALLSKYNLLPSPTTLSMDAVTGSGSELNRIDGSRLNAVDRTNDRMNGINVDQKRQETLQATPINPTGLP